MIIKNLSKLRKKSGTYRANYFLDMIRNIMDTNPSNAYAQIHALVDHEEKYILRISKSNNFVQKRFKMYRDLAGYELQAIFGNKMLLVNYL